MENQCYWRFVSNQNSTINGINDAGIETFTANIVHSLVRETIQNSLDAQLVKTKPVTIEFSQFILNTDNFPDNSRFQGILESCYESNKDEADSEEFFDNALKIYSEPLRVMRVSDFNTYGLIGADKCEKGSPWSRLVKENGSSNKAQTSGGSFGIGKSAAYACSDLRTIFYSSLDKLGIESNIGVSRLVSYREEEFDDWTTGIGYYSDDNKLTAIREQAEFSSEYKRVEPGTDIYIIGFSKMNNLDKEIIFSILKNFLVSIWKNLLVVNVAGEIINKSTIGNYVDQLNPYDGKETKEIIDYYFLLSSSNTNILRIPLDNNEYGKLYGFESGECILYLMEGNKLNSRIMMTRSAGMKLFNQDYIDGTIDFTGILMIEGETMNKAFRLMEVPSHDAWEPGRCKEKEKLSNKMYSELRKYLREKVRENFAKANSSQLDAFGVSDFLPDKIASKDANGIVKEKLMDQIKNVFGKDMKPKKKTPRRIEIEVLPPDSLSVKKTKMPGNKPIKNDEAKNGNDKGFKFIDIKERVICKNKELGLYIIKYIAPNNARRARLDFYINGEQSDYDFPVEAAAIKSGKALVQMIKDNKIYLENIQKSDTISIELKFNFNQYCFMEANYYESKK